MMGLQLVMGLLVGNEGFEPSRYYYQQILSLLRLPISPNAQELVEGGLFGGEENGVISPVIRLLGFF